MTEFSEQNFLKVNCRFKEISCVCRVIYDGLICGVSRMTFSVPVLDKYAHTHTHTQTPPVCSLMIKYQRTALDILLVEQDGSTGVTKVGYCGPHPTNACLPFTCMRKKWNRLLGVRVFLVSASSGHLFSNPYAVLFRSLILRSEVPPKHTHTATSPHPPHASRPL